MMLAGRYRLDMPLGRGGMGEVWMGVDERLNRPVAVKLLTESAMGDDHSAARFRREARTAARLNHPRIVTVYDFGVSDGRCFLTMELVNGSSLAHELRRRGPLGPARVAAIAAQAAEGLAEAHRQGVVHRDVKPSNLLLDEDNMVKVADFGVARCPSSETTTSTTGAGLITGTSLYLAPEAALGGKAGAAGDVYALGCALYELLAGRPPFTGEHPVAVMCQHVETPPVPPCRVCPGLPEAFGDILLRMLAKTPDERPTAREVAEWFGTARDRVADRVVGEGSGPPKTVAIRRPAGPLARTVVAPAAADVAVAPTRRRLRGPVVAGAVTTAAALTAAVVVLTTLLSDGAPHGYATGPRPSAPASGPSGARGVGLREPGVRTGADQGQASGRPISAGLTSGPAAARSAAPVPETAARPSREPTTAPAKTPSPTSSTSAPASPSAPPSSLSPSPSATASAQATMGSGGELRGGRGD